MMRLFAIMLAGGFIGWFVGKYLSIGGAFGMMAGGMAWLAYETRRMENGRKLMMEKELELLRKVDWRQER